MKPVVRGRGVGGLLFLGLVLLAHAAAALLEPDVAAQARAAFVRMAGSVVPVLLLVFALVFLVERFLTPERTRSWLGRGSGWRGWLLALAAGVVSTGPVYAWYSLLAELRGKGMRDGLVAVSLYARAIKLPLLPLLVHYFGLAYMLVLSLWLAVFALVTGVLAERLARTADSR
jgi:uncharacterized membrane protein YraQ (UPF0718 family)